MTTETRELTVPEESSISLELSDQAIEITKRNIALCQQLVTDVLERNIDYGTIPGVPTPFLWDAGAAKIMSAFNCYAEYTTVRVIDLPGKLTYTVYSKLVNRRSQQVIATGIGAASTREIKHRYRWVSEPEKDGISRKGLKTRPDGKYRIPNPDTEDLLNTIVKMAAKRADVDAAQSLPGVAATLRKLFLSSQQPKPRPDPRPPTDKAGGGHGTPPPSEKQSWSHFWSKLNTLGITSKEAHDILSVNSIKNDWLGVQGRTLDEAYAVIKDAVDLINAGKEVDAEWLKQQHTSDTEPQTEPLFPE